MKVFAVLGFLGRIIGRAGHFIKVFILGFMIGTCIGIMAGRVAERFRLSDFVSIEKMILERENPPVSKYHGPPQLSPPNQSFRM